MELEDIFDIGRFIGTFKIWTIQSGSTDSPFYQTLTTPLNLLKSKL